MIITDFVYKEGTLSDIKEHAHGGYQLIYLAEGRVTIQIEGREYLATAPAAVLLNAFEAHKITVASADSRRYAMQLNVYETDALLSSPQLSGMLKHRPNGYRNVFGVVFSAEETEGLFERLYREYLGKRQQREAVIKHGVGLLINFLYREMPYTQKAKIEDKIQSIVEYIEKNYALPITVQGIADAFFINVSYLSHLFKRQVGYSPKEYVTLTRLSASLGLLSSTRLTVTQIAAAVGYGDSNGFIRDFKKHFGNTPSKHR